MVGPTGVGKTEISSRLSKLAQAPFMKVEAIKIFRRNITRFRYYGENKKSKPWTRGNTL